ncbi:amidohydrolase family protein [Streptomyces sp. NBC_01602]|uniref:amidohydrolase family protein n=1 Tax=Streptomyces sp. NBC_01602 TaxID=2975893 RepID=UPI00386C31AB|nr:amidohydrolase family protein [Streptomyces sp. NBC_01602]
MSTAAPAEHFAYFAAGERCGDLTVTREEPGRISTDFAVSNNGRGARLHETLRLDDRLLPLDWTVDGTSLMGGAVHERLSLDGATQSWTSQAEEGSHAGQRRLYLPTDSSPYANWTAAQAALAAGGTIAVLPTGNVSAELLKQTTLDDIEQPVNVYILRGVGLRPAYILADAEMRLIAWLGAGDLLVREEYADQHGVLAGLEGELTHTHLEQVQTRIRHRYAAPVRICDVRVFDPSRMALTDPMSVTWYRGRITTVEPEAQAVPVDGEVVIDGDGGTLLAGLHDMHAHVRPMDGLFYLAAGVTTVRDMGNANDALAALTARWDAGVTAGPTAVPSGFIEGRSEHSALLGVIPETLDDALEAVRWYAARGYHQIKIYNSMSPDWVPALAAEAHRLGLRVVGHIPAFTTPDRMIEAGYDEITHVNQLMLGWLLDDGEDTRTPLRLTALARAKDLDLDSEAVHHTLKRMRDGGIGLDTTAVIVERLMLSRARTVLPADAPFLTHMPAAYQRQRKRTYVPGTDEQDFRAYDESFPKVLEVIKLLHDHGIPLWPGTDDSTGFTVHRELELYVEAGLTPAEVLRIATQDCAAHLGLGHSHGSIERGKSASFLLLDGDPLVDISAVRKIRMVAKDGDIYHPQELYTELGITPFSSPPAMVHGGSQ